MHVDYVKREIVVKLVYFGPGLGGKTTCLQYLYQKTPPELRTQLFSLATDSERTLAFTMTPQSVPPIAGLRLRLGLYTTPGPVFNDVSRRLAVKGADAVMFVVDSQAARFDANIESLEELEGMLATGVAARPDIPRVIAYNKRDLASAMPIAELAAAIDPQGRWPGFELVAHTGVGVFDSLKALVQPVVAALRAELEAPGPS